MALDFAATYGLELDGAYPYAQKTQTCPADGISKKALAGRVVKLKQVGQDEDYKYGSVMIKARSKLAMLQAVARGPIAIYFHVDTSFLRYRSGVYLETTCAAKEVNHAMVGAVQHMMSGAKQYSAVQYMMSGAKQYSLRKFDV